MALKWTKRSFPPSSGVMNPKPLSALNHLTVPVANFLFHLPRALLMNGTKGTPAPSDSLRLRGECTAHHACARRLRLRRGRLALPGVACLHDCRCEPAMRR